MTNGSFEVPYLAWIMKSSSVVWTLDKNELIKYNHRVELENVNEQMFSNND